MNIAENSDLWRHPYYETIKLIVSELEQQNLLTSGAGYGYAMSDLIQHQLAKHNIKSSIIECELSIIGTDPLTYTTVGNEVKIVTAGAIESKRPLSHVIVIVEHPDIPLLVDCSIGNILPDPYTWVCSPAGYSSDIGKITRNNWQLTYRSVTGSLFPSIHQKSIIDRLAMDQKIESIIAHFKLFRWIAIGFVVINSTILTYDLYITGNVTNMTTENSNKINLLEHQQADVLERLRSYRDTLLDLQNSLIRQSRR